MIRYVLKKELLSILAIAMFLLTSIFLTLEFKGTVNALNLTTEETYNNFLFVEQKIPPFGELFFGNGKNQELISNYFNAIDLESVKNPFTKEAYGAFSKVSDIYEFDSLLYGDYSFKMILYKQAQLKNEAGEFSDEALNALSQLVQAKDSTELANQHKKMQDSFPMINEWYYQNYKQFSEDYYTTMSNHRNLIYLASGTSFEKYQEIVKASLEGTTVSEQYARKFAMQQLIVWGLFIFILTGYLYTKYHNSRSKQLFYSKSYSSMHLMINTTVTQICIVSVFMLVQMLAFGIYLNFGLEDAFKVNIVDYINVFIQVCMPTIFFLVVCSSFIVHATEKFQFGFPIYLVLFVLFIGTPANNYSSVSPIIRHDVIHALTRKDYMWLLTNRVGFMIISLIGLYGLIKLHDWRRTNVYG